MIIEINPASSRGRQIDQTPRQSQRPESMSGTGYLKFRNDRGVSEIRIGVREFKCIGESLPQDHPHVYINMGEAEMILCPYCGTRFLFIQERPQREILGAGASSVKKLLDVRICGASAG